ncbi:MAG: 5-oxoprolinase subunit PxpB [Clostridium sp.]|jgi:inhibitor of KinA|uniref:5-oxoprolinase subunit PxpB n=1 Tax=Clostridium sp. TaxID=1506 RepID=UPI0025C658D4|nr:5-oxoprolinase subunit PxpB [Clostridium sp.]MCH3963516.1 5-oxoprolinase subunit PxpB [Clostridium sp.]MCI1714657.1 5-oxoprolinase subunit PxpB [Clostridium sp.]MCI1799154.1 5-oxoprolinase subunit PxpB [Clostridium sp.]MCI1812840.1 5-oxoprolinase subunit PxpB [Clostridium sp.]MCI1869730.1 5-oxoprolinase subunit PxpB [Clostridium sp.]
MVENEFNILQASETSALVEFGNKIDEGINKQIRIFCAYLDENPFHGLIEYIPYFSSVSLIYDPLKMGSEEPFKVVRAKIEDILSKLDFSCSYEENIVEIPVCYGGEFGPDIGHVAEVNNLTEDEVVKIHSSGRYLVYMIGFAPGFPYLGGMSEKIYTPRRKSPRTKIPEGSVGIAGKQTGVYPIETPGGWQIIGRTPLKLFDLESSRKTLLKCGDIAKFYPISCNEYIKLKEKML